MKRCFTPDLRALVLASVLLLAATPAAALSFVNGEISANYWYASPAGDLFYGGDGPANAVENDLGLEGEGQISVYARLGLPIVTFDGHTTSIGYTGKTQNSGTYDSAYASGESTEFNIELTHAGVMFNPLSLMEVVDIGVGLGLTAVNGEVRVGSREDSKVSVLFTGKAEVRVYLPATPCLAALSYRSSDYVDDINAELGYKLATFVQARAGYRHITFDDDRYDGTITGLFAGLSAVF